MPSIFSATLRCEFVSQKSSLQDTHLMNRLPLCKASGQIRYPHPGPPHAWPEGAVPARCGPGSSLTTTPPSPPPACSGVWDNITCWRPADVGETVTVPCPKLFSNFYSKPGTGPYLSFFFVGEVFIRGSGFPFGPKKQGVCFLDGVRSWPWAEGAQKASCQAAASKPTWRGHSQESAAAARSQHLAFNFQGT